MSISTTNEHTGGGISVFLRSREVRPRIHHTGILQVISTVVCENIPTASSLRLVRLAPLFGSASGTANSPGVLFVVLSLSPDFGRRLIGTEGATGTPSGEIRNRLLDRCAHNGRRLGEGRRGPYIPFCARDTGAEQGNIRAV